MPINIQDFKQGIFALHTSRFGKVAELMIKQLIGAVEAQGTAHDLTLADDINHRIEVKFSRALKENDEVITEQNVIEQILSTRNENRILASSEIFNTRFNCNIQQIKPVEFDTLYYGLFCQDEVLIFRVSSNGVTDLPNYSNRQHRGNEGEGQFHLNQDTILHHYQNYLYNRISYEGLLELLSHE